MMLASEDKCRLKSLIYDTVLWMCKDGLVPQIPGEFCVEGLIGVRLGPEDLMLVSINEQLNGGADGEGCTSPRKRRKRRPWLTGDVKASPSKSLRTTDRPSSPKSVVLKTLKSDTADKNTTNCESVSDNGLNIENTWGNHQVHGETDSEGATDSEGVDNLQTSAGNIATENLDSISDESQTVQDNDTCITDTETRDELIEASPDSVIVIATKEVRARNPNPPNLSMVSVKTEPVEADCLQVTGVVENRRNNQQYTPPTPTPRDLTFQSNDATTHEVNNVQHAVIAADTFNSFSHQSGNLQAIVNITNQGISDMLDKSHTPLQRTRKPIRKKKVKTPVYKLKCQECEKTFSTRSHLSSHMLVHTGEKPYSCSVCEKAFAHKHQLKRHSHSLHSDAVTRNIPEGEGNVRGPPTRRSTRRSSLIAQDLNESSLKLTTDNGDNDLANENQNAFSDSGQDGTDNESENKTLCSDSLNDLDILPAAVACDRDDFSNTCEDVLSNNDNIVSGNESEACGDDEINSEKEVDKPGFNMLGIATGSDASLNNSLSGQDVQTAAAEKSNEAVLKRFKCEFCGKRYRKRAHLTSHILVHTGEKDHSCFLCEKAFARKHQLTRHLKIMHSHKPVVKPKLKTPKPFMCTECGKCFSRRLFLDSHSRIHTGERPHMCSHCGRSFSEKHHLRRHMTIHTGEKNHQCLHCGKCFSVASNLKIHTRIHTGEKPYRCEICDRGFRCPSNYHRHMKDHRKKTILDLGDGTGKDSISIETESAVDRVLSFDIKSVQTGDADRPLVCEYCAKLFPSHHKLKRHLLTHSERNNICGYCGKRFRQVGELNIHIRVHTGDKPFQCEICSKCYSCPSNFRRHLQRHRKNTNLLGDSSVQNQLEIKDDEDISNSKIDTGYSRSNSCDVCSKSFASELKLKRHLVSHSDKNHQCGYCDKRFCFPGELKIHTRIHTGEKPYQCRVCSKCFGNPSNYIRHMKSHRSKTAVDLDHSVGSVDTDNIETPLEEC